MGRILSYVMFGFFVCTTIMSASVLRSREKLEINNILFALVCIRKFYLEFLFWIYMDSDRSASCILLAVCGYGWHIYVYDMCYVSHCNDGVDKRDCG